MRVLVTGGRDFADRAFVFYQLDFLHNADLAVRPTPLRDRAPWVTEIIHGACGWDADSPGSMRWDNMKGADAHADAWAIARRVRVIRYPAYWKSQGNLAGPFRNQLMVDLRPEIVLAFPGNRGTNGCVKLAEEAGIQVIRCEPKS